MPKLTTYQKWKEDSRNLKKELFASIGKLQRIYHTLSYENITDKHFMLDKIISDISSLSTVLGESAMSIGSSPNIDKFGVMSDEQVKVLSTLATGNARIILDNLVNLNKIISSLETIEVDANYDTLLKNIIHDIRTQVDILDDYKLGMNESILTNSSKYEGCVMLRLETLDICWNHVYSQVPKEYLHTYGLEKDLHVTLLYGLNSSIDPKLIYETIRTFSYPEVMYISNPNYFECPEFDVLKYNCAYSLLYTHNAKLKEFDHKVKFPIYVPHAIVAYLKKGSRVDIHPKSIQVRPTELYITGFEGEKTVIDIWS